VPILRSLFSRLANERLEAGTITSNSAPAVEMISVAVMISKLNTSLTFGIPKTVASVFGMAMTNVIQVRANITHVRPAMRLFSLSFEAVN